MILIKQEWRVKEKTNVRAPTSSDDDMDLLDDDESIDQEWVSATDRHGYQHGIQDVG
jgi:hypothetical protein